MGRRPRLRPRQGDDGSRISMPTRLRPLTGCRCDGIPYRTYPARIRTRAPSSTRHLARRLLARYPNAAPDYVYNMQRRLRNSIPARSLVPQPIGSRRWRRAPRRDLFRFDQSCNGRGHRIVRRRRHRTRHAEVRPSLSGFGARLRVATSACRGRAEPRCRSFAAARQRFDLDPARLVAVCIMTDADNGEVHCREIGRNCALRVPIEAEEGFRHDRRAPSASASSYPYHRRSRDQFLPLICSLVVWTQGFSVSGRLSSSSYGEGRIQFLLFSRLSPQVAWPGLVGSACLAHRHPAKAGIQFCRSSSPHRRLRGRRVCRPQRRRVTSLERPKK